MERKLQKHIFVASKVALLVLGMANSNFVAQIKSKEKYGEEVEKKV